jgi:type IV pilus assembly protein PilA
MLKRNKEGFTLIELMIVVAIIGILADIAIPNFLKFQAKAKQAEAKSNLSAIYVAQVAYFSNTNTYADTIAPPAVNTCMMDGATVLYENTPNDGSGCFCAMNWKPAGQTRYTYQCGNNTHIIDSKLGTPQYVWDCPPVITTSSTDISFIAAAVGNVDGDVYPDCWSINELNALKNEFNDI